ncbi:hypothethical protein (plasmid) [Ralstonia solanacearum CMR15]|nr:hypothethical protein [Ralstonia solanacearum CMR15]
MTCIGKVKMPKFACRCGNLLNLSGVWPECEWRLVPMERMSEVADRLDTDNAPTSAPSGPSMHAMKTIRIWRRTSTAFLESFG